MNYIVFSLLCAGLFLSQGCAHHQLRFNSAAHAKTVADVQTQQVLDNLAKFVANPNSLPYFEYPNQGGSGVVDNINGTTAFGFNDAKSTFGFGGSRTSDESFIMTPINDPRKLELMRCAYQRAIGVNCGSSLESGRCPDCSARFNEFYLGDASPSRTKLATDDGRQIFLHSAGGQQYDNLQNPIGTRVVKNINEVNKVFYTDLMTGDIFLTVEQAEAEKDNLHDLYVDDSVAAYTHRSGKVTAECLGENCWFRVGDKSSVPKNYKGCCYVGHYCNTYVWVPESGRNELTKLTLTILDIAIHDPPAQATKEVVAYLSDKLALSNEKAAAYKVTAKIPLSSSVEQVVPEAAKITQALNDLEFKHMKALIEQRAAERQRDVSNKNLDKSVNDNRTTLEAYHPTFKGLKNNTLSASDITKVFNENAVQKSHPQNESLSDVQDKAQIAEKAEAEVKIKTQIADEIGQQIIQQRELLPSESYSSPIPALRPEYSTPPGSPILPLQQQLRLLGR